MTETLTKTGKPRKARERHVFPTDEVAHIWARQTQRDGRNPRNNFFFHDETIWSYGNHFPIATFVDKNVVLLTTRGYSSTTAGHIACVRGAIPPDVTRIDVDNIRADNKAAYQHNIDELWETLTARCEEQRRSRKRDYSRDIQNQILNIERYTKLVKLGRTKRLAELVATIGNSSWGRVLGLTEDETRSINQKRDTFRIVDEQRNEEKNRLAREARETEAKLVQPLVEAAWRNGQYSVTIPGENGSPARSVGVGNYTYRLPTMLRLNADKSEVETSHGARISVETAKRIWPVLQRRGLPDETIEGYRPIGWHTSDDTMQIGCHRIPFGEMQRMAEELGLVKREEVTA